MKEYIHVVMMNLENEMNRDVANGRYDLLEYHKGMFTAYRDILERLSK